MNKRNALIGLVLILFVAVAGYWWWAPIRVLHQMEQAAAQQDSEGINRHVDYPALRESFRTQFSAAVDKQMSQAKDNPIAQLAGTLALGLANTMVDALVRPETIAAAMTTGRVMTPKSSASAPNKPDDSRKVVWKTEREGLDRMLARPHRQGEPVDEKAPAFVFVRKGFAEWKLAEIRLALEK